MLSLSLLLLLCFICFFEGGILGCFKIKGHKPVWWSPKGEWRLTCVSTFLTLIPGFLSRSLLLMELRIGFRDDACLVAFWPSNTISKRLTLLHESFSQAHVFRKVQHSVAHCDSVATRRRLCLTRERMALSSSSEWGGQVGNNTVNKTTK